MGCIIISFLLLTDRGCLSQISFILSNSRCECINLFSENLRIGLRFEDICVELLNFFCSIRDGLRCVADHIFAPRLEFGELNLLNILLFFCLWMPCLLASESPSELGSLQQQEIPAQPQAK